MSIELKIKSKHLALEPAIIRKEERKLLKQIKSYKEYHQVTINEFFVSYKEHPDLNNLQSKYSRLVSHRRCDVKNESRATYLARAFIKGVPYKAVEANTTGKLSEPVMNSLVKMVIKYGPVRYANELDKTGTTFKVVKTSYEKAREDVEKWLENEE
jgi:hypothetical protein